ncbi:hypothetical protein CFC21_103541 [Triticum aestivum]|uniref:Uncharacterized protein n=2 Tax=Triticum aestivum TaxID=4565 RepID=A0A3B6SN63_WHEAT|nr:hypothetical protein CFC21_103541 [Triticum aestivum]
MPRGTVSVGRPTSTALPVVSAGTVGTGGIVGMVIVVAARAVPQRAPATASPPSRPCFFLLTPRHPRRPPINEATCLAPARQDEQLSSFTNLVRAWKLVVAVSCVLRAPSSSASSGLWHAAAGVGDAVMQSHQVSPKMSFDGRPKEHAHVTRRVAAEDTPDIVDAFRRAAGNAIDAGLPVRAWELVASNCFRVTKPNSLFHFCNQITTVTCHGRLRQYRAPRHHRLLCQSRRRPALDVIM